MNSKFLIFSLVIATVFTVSLTENLQSVDGIAASGDTLRYEVDVGETQMLTWLVLNDEEKALDIEFYATGEGSELLVFEEFVTMDPKSNQRFEIFVSVPDDHPDNVEYHLTLFALTRGEKIEGAGAGIVMNLQMQTSVVIKIGDNPIFTHMVEDPVIEEEIVKEEIMKEEEVEKPVDEEITPTETMAEKLARIQAANDDNKIEEQPITDKLTETQPSIPDIGYEEEPVAEVTYEEESTSEDGGGGCLIATATYGSELAPQVQLLREIRDNTLLSTNSGASFMESFNQVYYSFSPYIADMERESPLFKEAVKLVLTPMLSTLSIMTLADDGSESQVLGLGISVIALNLAMYIGMPAIIINRLKR